MSVVALRCCVTLCCVTLCCVTLCCVTLCCVTLCCVVLCCVVLCCVVLCCVVLCCVVLCCVCCVVFVVFLVGSTTSNWEWLYGVCNQNKLLWIPCVGPGMDKYYLSNFQSNLVHMHMSTD